MPDHGYDDYPTLENCFFDVVKSVKDADIDKYKYSGYGIGFDRNKSSSFPGAGFYKNSIIFGLGMSSFVHVANRKKDILILGDAPTQGLYDNLDYRRKGFNQFYRI